MEKLSYTFEVVDNGIVIHDNVTDTKEVYQRQGDDYRECYKRGLSDTICSFLSNIMLFGTARLEAKDKFNIKIEIR